MPFHLSAANRIVLSASVLTLGAMLGNADAVAASCQDYARIEKMTASKFEGVKTRDYAIASTEIVDAFPGAKLCTRINDAGETPDYTIDGVHCRFPEVDANASASHAKMVKELKKCLSGWSQQQQPEPNNALRVTYTAPDSSRGWIVSLLRNQESELVLELKYKLKVAAPKAPPPGYDK